jgi:hypothetical protein
MRVFPILKLAPFIGLTAWAQVQVGVWTDKPAYQAGEVIQVTVTAYNPTVDTMDLYFSTGCQQSCVIDTFDFKNHVTCAAIVTMQRIPPLDAFLWPSLKYPFPNSGWPVLAPGPHTVVGEVLGYGLSDTLLIMVTSTTSVSSSGPVPMRFSLGPSFPNPFNGETTIPFTVSESQRLVLSIYSSTGQLVRTLLDEMLSAGNHQFRANLAGLPSGTYWCSLKVGEKRQTQRLVLIR